MSWSLVLSFYDPGPHDIYHVKRATEIALHLLPPQSTPSDIITTKYISWFHDIGQKFCKDGQLHEEIGAKIAHTLFEGSLYCNRICKEIRTHPADPKYPNWSVLKEADVIDALGAIGVLRGLQFHDLKGIQRSPMDYIETVLEHYKPFMEKSPLINERYETFQAFCDEGLLNYLSGIAKKKVDFFQMVKLIHSSIPSKYESFKKQLDAEIVFARQGYILKRL